MATTREVIERNYCGIRRTCRCRKLKSLVGELITFTNIQSKPQRLKGLVLKCYPCSRTIWDEYYYRVHKFCSFVFLDNRGVSHTIGTPYVDIDNIEVLSPEENLIFRLEHNISTS